MKKKLKTIFTKAQGCGYNRYNFSRWMAGLLHRLHRAACCPRSFPVIRVGGGGGFTIHTGQCARSLIQGGPCKSPSSSNHLPGWGDSGRSRITIHPYRIMRFLSSPHQSDRSKQLGNPSSAVAQKSLATPPQPLQTSDWRTSTENNSWGKPNAPRPTQYAVPSPTV